LVVGKNIKQDLLSIWACETYKSYVNLLNNTFDDSATICGICVKKMKK